MGDSMRTPVDENPNRAKYYTGEPTIVLWIVSASHQPDFPQISCKRTSHANLRWPPQNPHANRLHPFWRELDPQILPAITGSASAAVASASPFKSSLTMYKKNIMERNQHIQRGVKSPLTTYEEWTYTPPPSRP